MNKKLLIQILTSVFITSLGLFLIYQGYKYLDSQVTETVIFNSDRKIHNPNINKDVTISGVWSCLPSNIVSEDGIECVMGLKTSEGNFYDLINYTKYAPNAVKQGKVSVTGKPGTTMTSKNKAKVNIFLVTKI